MLAEALLHLAGEGLLLLCPRWSDACALALCLAEVRRPGSIAEARCLVACGEIEQSVERARIVVHGGVRVADPLEAFGHREEGEVRGFAGHHLVPRKRCGDAGIGQRAHRVGRAGGAVLRVLVVVEEDAVALLLPPLRAGKLRDAALDGT